MSWRPEARRPQPEERKRASASFLVRCVRATPTAVFLELEPLARVALALGRHVVAPFALLTRKGQRRSFVGSHL